MKETKLLRKKIILKLLIYALSISLFTTGLLSCFLQTSVFAQETIDSVNYTTERQDLSWYNDEGKLKLLQYYDKITLDSVNVNTERINSYLTKNYNSFLDNAAENIEWAKESSSMYESSHYTDTLEISVSNNANGILSLKKAETWYMGGVGQLIISGESYNLNTGEKLKLTDVFHMTDNEIEEYLKSQTIQYINANPDMFWWNDTVQNAIDIVNSYSLDKFNYYIENNNVVLCYPVYELGPGAMGCVVVECPIINSNVNEKKDDAATKEIKVVLDGAKIEFDQPPAMIDNRVMVPIRAIFEAMGYTVDWNAKSSTAVAVKGSDRIIVQMGNSIISYTVGGKSNSYKCDVKPQIISDRVLVPVRAIAESAGCTVEWDNFSRTVYIYTRETDTDSEIENYLKGSTWILDADRTYAETGVSVQTMFGSSIEYSSKMRFGSDGGFWYYVASRYGGTGTYTVDNGYIQFAITPYEDDVESGVIYFDSEHKSLMMEIGGFNTHWKLSMDYDKILYENNVMDYAYLLPDDYDGDGQDEAYIIVALPVDDWAEWDEFQEIEFINVYFISSDGSFYKVDSLDGVGVYTGKVTVSNGKFVTIEMSYGGSSSFTKIYGCNAGIPFVPQISGKVGGFCLSGDKYVCYADDLSKGYHDYVETELEYDANTREFSIKRDDSSRTLYLHNEETGLAKEVFTLVNEERMATGVEPLVWDDALAKIAEDYSLEMATENNFSHTGTDGSTLGTRLISGNIEYTTTAGENIAKGQKTAKAVVGAWMKSEGHRANILNPRFTRIGVGVAYDSEGVPYWTQDFCD